MLVLICIRFQNSSQIRILKSHVITFSIGKRWHMNLKNLTNQNLDTNLKSLVASEREILSQILLHVAEVERRKLYLAFGFSSLFDYLTKSVGYANGSAQRRIDAARLSFDAPEVIEKLESGELNLAQVSLLQKSIREVQTLNKNKVDAKTKEILILQLSNKSFSESEILVSQILNIQPLQQAKAKHQQDESVRLEITFSKAQWEKLNRMRELLSNSLPHGSSWNQVLEYVSEKVIQQKDKTRVVKKLNVPKKSKFKSPEQIENQNTIPSEKKFNVPVGNSLGNAHTTVEIAKARKPIPMAVQRNIFNRDQSCQFKNKLTGKQCETKWQLTIDHIHPIWAGGNNASENLRLLCATHNREVYRKQANLSAK